MGEVGEGRSWGYYRYFFSLIPLTQKRQGWGPPLLSWVTSSSPSWFLGGRRSLCTGFWWSAGWAVCHGRVVAVMGGGPVWLSGWGNVQGHSGFCRASTVYKSGVVLTCQDQGEAVGSSWAILTPFWVTNIMKNRPNTFKSSEWRQNLKQKWVWFKSVKGQSSVHECWPYFGFSLSPPDPHHPSQHTHTHTHTRVLRRHQHWGSVHVVTRKLDLDQTSMTHTHTVRHKCDKNSLVVANFGFICLIWLSLDDSDDICDPEWRLKCPRNFRPPPWILTDQDFRSQSV